MNETQALPTVWLPLAELKQPNKNPNKMDPEMYGRLVSAIKRFGFLQPGLVREDDGGGHVIVDGVHRCRAAKDLGMTQVPCVLSDVAEDGARALQIGMNRMRGELDLAKVADVLTDLAAEGWSDLDLSVTGFAMDEIRSLLAATSETPEEDAMVGASQVEEEPKDDSGKAWVLELVFESKTALSRAKRALRKAAGKGNELSVGLFKILDTEE